MTTGPQQTAPSSAHRSSRPIATWSWVLLLALLALALGATYAVVGIRGEAALDCNDMDAHMGSGLNVLMLFLGGTNVTAALLSWLVFGRRLGVPGGLAALVVTTMVLVLTAVGAFMLLPLPDMAFGCPTGEPPWWPTWLPS